MFICLLNSLYEKLKKKGSFKTNVNSKESCLFQGQTNKLKVNNVRINNVTSDFETIISGVPQGSIVDPILFNCFFNDFFYFIEKASVHNFADDNTLSMFEETIQNLIALLETESNTAIE